MRKRQVLRLTGALALLLIAGGCGGDDEASASAGGAPAPNVTGTIIDTYITEAGDVDVPVDPSSVKLQALIPGGGDAWNTIDAAVAADGTFVIPHVTPGTYYLKYGDSEPLYLVTSARSLDLGKILVGRPDATAAKTSPTNLVISADGLSAWQPTDVLELSSLGAGTSDLLSYGAENPPTPGDTALKDMTCDVTSFVIPTLIEGDKGDTALLTQLVTRDAGGVAYTSVSKALALAPFTMADGQPTKISGSFEDVPQIQVSLEWRRSQFHALEKDINPAAQVQASDYLSLFAQQGGPSRSANGGVTPTLASVNDSANTDVTLDLSYGDPYPAGWGVLGFASSTFLFEVTVPGFAAPQVISGFTATLAPVEDLASGEVAPLVGPARDITVGGKAAKEAISEVGLAPEIRWSPPSIGASVTYRVSVNELDSSGFWTPVAIFLTADTSVTVPPGLLTKGRFYYVSVASETGADLRKPYKRGTKSGLSEALTSLIAP